LRDRCGDSIDTDLFPTQVIRYAVPLSEGIICDMILELMAKYRLLKVRSTSSLC